MAFKKTKSTDVRTGSHPIFHDLDRTEALRKTEGNRDPDVLLLRGTLGDAHERIAQLTAIVAQVYDALGDDRAKTFYDVPDAVDTALGLLASFEESTAKLDGELEETKKVLKEVENEREAHKMTILALRVAHAEELRNRAASSGGSEERIEALKSSVARLAGMEARVAELEGALGYADAEAKASRAVAAAARADSARLDELLEVEPLATAFAYLVSDLAVKLDVGEAAEDTVEAFKTALAVLEAP